MLAIKSFREVHSHTSYFFCAVCFVYFYFVICPVISSHVISMFQDSQFWNYNSLFIHFTAIQASSDYIYFLQLRPHVVLKLSIKAQYFITALLEDKLWPFSAHLISCSVLWQWTSGQWDASWQNFLLGGHYFQEQIVSFRLSDLLMSFNLLIGQH